MPSITSSYNQAGPLLQVHIGLSAPHAAALKAQGKPVPPMATGVFLLDTGASGTCVDPALVSGLGLTPTGAVMIQTPSTAGTPVACPQYDVQLVMFASNTNLTPFVVSALPVMETALKSQGIDGLLGRDVLDRCVLNYIGPTKQLVLSY